MTNSKCPKGGEHEWVNHVPCHSAEYDECNKCNWRRNPLHPVKNDLPAKGGNMEIKRTMIEKIRIERAPNLDPVELFLEDFGEGAGKIIITCFTESWTSYWGSMGMPLKDFIIRTDDDYLINCLSRGITHKIKDEDKDGDFLKSLVLKERRKGYIIDRREAREAWNDIEYLNVNADYLMHCPTPQSLKFIEGIEEPWYFDWPEQDNPKYKYLQRIVNTVKEALKHESD